MLPFIKYLFSYFFPGDLQNSSDDDKEEFLANELVELEVNEQASEKEANSIIDIPRNTLCYQRTGVITYVEENYVLIDGSIFFDITACNLNLKITDKVLYLCYKDLNETIVVVRILENQGIYWGDSEHAIEECSYNITEHVFVGEVDFRQDRMVFIKDSSLKFDLDNVTAKFIPIQGDFLEILCKIKVDDEKLMDIGFDQVLEVLSFKPVRSKIISTVITVWNGENGVCDKLIFFDKNCIINSEQTVTVGSKAFIEAIESNQSPCTWRAIRLHITETYVVSNVNTNIIDEIEEKSLDLEKKQNIEVTFPLKFGEVHFLENPVISLDIKNNSDQTIVLNKCVLLGKTSNSQFKIRPHLSRPKNINPEETFSVTVTCFPKFYGQSKERLILAFKEFQIERLIEVNILTPNSNIGNVSETQHKTEKKKIEMLNEMRSDTTRHRIPGVKVKRSPNFISVKLGMFPIPERVWAAVLGNSNETIYHVDYSKIISRIEMNLPCLLQTLNINNYMDRWHTLLFMEEIQNTLDMRSYDIPKGFLTKYQDFFGIEIKGLTEKRPSLIVGDQVIVKDLWDETMPLYEGFIHTIKGDLILIKFHPQFHEYYLGGDVSIQFSFNRSMFRRFHQAINMAISNLGVDVLFPSRIQRRPPQIAHDKLKTMEWYNKNLNDGQKTSVRNILLGEYRPMPYCIYGPPGTGKTITVVETILQILNHLPYSRILVAAPSNSAANIITERLLQYKEHNSHSVIRIIANYLVDSENIPDEIKPYCATINIAREDTVKSSHEVKNGINHNVPASYIARYRVLIGTCGCLGQLAQIGLPRGHFTHIIVDEAGQALEPEIMIPLAFVDKENGQIVLAGDPMQLGPVVISKYCKEFGFDESYFSRLLQTYPYQRDYHGFTNGFNEKLVTRLSDNYRSLEEVITLPSEMFYDASLVANLDRNMPWIGKMLDVIYEVFDISNEVKTGGIFVHGIRGCNTRADDSPSWYNPQEASMVALTACKLYKKNITPDEIGIITPYIAQIKYIRLLFDAMGLPRPKIGSVEEFQGQERPLIILSTVRTSTSDVTVDQKHALGFVKNPKRLNVALTRAQVAVLLFCDPHLLVCDPLWQRVINYAIKNDKYIGCNLPPGCTQK